MKGIGRHLGMRPGQVVLPALVIALTTLLCGCVKSHESSGVLTIEFSNQVIGLHFLACVVGVITCWLFKRARNWFWAVAILICTVIYGVIAWHFSGGYIMLTDKVMTEKLGHLSDEKVVMKFSEVKRVTYSEKKERNSRGTSSTSHYAHLHFWSGGLETRRIGTMWHHANPTINQWLDEHGVRSGPDMAAFGFASDDPMEVGMLGTTYRYDSGSARNRFSAFLFGGGPGKSQRDDSGTTLADVLESKSSILGTWKMRIEDGERWASISLRFEEPDRFYFEAEASGDPAPVTMEGGFSESDSSLNFKLEGRGGSWSIMRK